MSINISNLMSAPLLLKVKAVQPNADAHPQFEIHDNQICFQQKNYKFSGIVDNSPEVWERLTASPAVLVLLGPSGGGKTTTLQSVLHHKLAQKRSAYFSVCEVAENRSFVDLLDNNSSKKYLSTMPLDSQLKKFKFSEAMVAKMLNQRKRGATTSNAQLSRSCLIVNIYEPEDNVVTVVDMMGSEKYEEASSNSFANSNVSSLTHQLLGASRARSSNLVTNLIFHKMPLTKMKFILHLDAYGNPDLIKSALHNIVDAIKGFKIEAQQKVSTGYASGKLPSYARPTLASSSPRKKAKAAFRVTKPRVLDTKVLQRIQSVKGDRTSKRGILDSLEAEVSTKQKLIAMLEEVVSSKDKEIASLKEQISVSVKDVITLKDAFALRLEEIEAEKQLELDSMNSKYAMNQMKLENLNATLNSQLEKLAAQDNEILNKTAELKERDLKMSVLENELESKAAQLEVKMQLIQTLEESTASQKSNLESVTSTAEELQTKISLLSADAVDKDTLISQLQGQVKKMEELLSGENEASRAMTTEIEAFKEVVSSRDAEIDSLKGELRSVVSNLEELGADKSSLLSKLASVEEEKASFERQYLEHRSALLAKETELLAQIDALKAESETKVRDLQKTVEQQEVTIQEMSSSLQKAKVEASEARSLQLTVEQQEMAIQEMSSNLQKSKAEAIESLAKAQSDAFNQATKVEGEHKQALAELQAALDQVRHECEELVKQSEQLKAQLDHMEIVNAVSHTASGAEVKRLESRVQDQEESLKQLEDVKSRYADLETSAKKLREEAHEKNLHNEQIINKLNDEIRELKSHTNPYTIGSENFGSDLADDLSESLGGDLSEHTFGYNPMDFAGVTSAFSPSEIFQDNSSHRDYMKMAKKAVKGNLHKANALRDSSNTVVLHDKKKVKPRTLANFSAPSPKATQTH